MCMENAIDVGGAPGEDNTIIILVDINTIEVGDKAEVGEGRGGFAREL
jgi:hypothetical protein